MDYHTKIDSDYSKQKITQNKKKPIPSPSVDRGSMLKKSEIYFIFMGAALVTLIIFFVFFRPSGTGFENNDTKGIVSSESLDKRISKLESLVKKYEELQADRSKNALTGDLQTDMDAFMARVERVEAALTVKFDIVTERLDHMEKSLDDFEGSIASIRQKSVTSGNSPGTAVSSEHVKKTEPSPKKKITPSPAKVSLIKKDPGLLHKNEKRTAAKKNIQPVAVQKTPPKKDQSVYYNVQKGDTLYSISRKFKISVLQLKKMNKMNSASTIFVGSKIKVRE